MTDAWNKGSTHTAYTIRLIHTHGYKASRVQLWVMKFFFQVGLRGYRGAIASPLQQFKWVHEGLFYPASTLGVVMAKACD